MDVRSFPSALILGLLLVAASVVVCVAQESQQSSQTAVPAPSGEYQAPAVGAVYTYRGGKGKTFESKVISVSGMTTNWLIPDGYDDEYAGLEWLRVISGNYAGTVYEFDKSKVAALWPLKVGNSVEFDSTYGSGASRNTLRVVSYEQVKVPAGTFNAFVVEKTEHTVTGWEGSYRSWIAPEVGLVKYETSSGKSLELVSIRLP